MVYSQSMLRGKCQVNLFVCVSLWRTACDCVTSWLIQCDDLTVWRVGRVTRWLWRVEYMTSWPCDEFVMWRVDWQPSVSLAILCSCVGSTQNHWPTCTGVSPKASCEVHKERLLLPVQCVSDAPGPTLAASQRKETRDHADTSLPNSAG